ncbi:tRNA (adenosine(37)-N6)-dimethylallyltransferase MiaA [Ignavibacterium sp.]|uniref:tRNA (adenosine(37)-N6)-dimethylallyltransferase MiaA n=1 Tax=Ignavibacterium sp. TaxID=2651167 RepID=UPI00220A566A|nr:tRNA (adenosine(37)-N6)-dimethylallyltransferase MiaA [Ignavibacterium sp.]BDQ03958.1 MAG: tRNA dimethylallyltransferase 2 [Ignavibacterium sp.]
MNYNLITILGPTAVGKTKLAAQLAHHFNGEIISADSRQVYRNLDIGTGKDLNDYVVEGKLINYHLIDITELPEEFNLFDFYKNFFNYYHQIKANHKTPFLVGGTGLYLSSIIQNYDLKEVENEKEFRSSLQQKSYDELKKILLELNPTPHNITDFESKERIIQAIIVAKAQKPVENKVEIHSLNIGINPGRDVVKKRIKERLEKRLKEGMIQEVEALLNKNIEPKRLIRLGLEYKFITEYLIGKISFEQMKNDLYKAICTFAKRQMTWFRKMEREGVQIFWLNEADFNKAKEIIQSNYEFV